MFYDKQRRIEELEKENKNLVEDFVKNYHLVILQKELGSSYGIKVYQDGKEIKYVHSVKFDADIENSPNLNLEVY